jgi:hypothetical protein
MALANPKGKISQSKQNRFIVASSPSKSDLQEIAKTLFSTLKPLEEGRFLIKEPIWLSGIRYQNTCWHGGILAFPADEIGQRKLLNQKGPTSSNNSRFFADVSNDFSNVKLSSQRVLRDAQDIFKTQTTCTRLLTQKGNIGIVDDISKSTGLKTSVVCFCFFFLVG